MAVIQDAYTSDVDWVNVTSYGADQSGVRDSTVAVQNALNATSSRGQVIYFPAGNYLFNGAGLTMASANTINGDGTGVTTLTMGAGFTGSSLITCSGFNNPVIQNMTITGASTTYSSNPAANGITFTNCQRGTLNNLYISYINGYAHINQATGSNYNIWPYLNNVHTYQGGGGIHFLGVTGSGFDVGAVMIGCNVEQTAGSLPGLLIEDCHDVFIAGLEGWNLPTSTAPATVVVKGNSQACYFYAVDLGGQLGTTNQTNAVVLVQTGTNGTPVDVRFISGILECGNPCFQVTAGTQVLMTGCRFYKGSAAGAVVSGTSTPDVTFNSCSFDTNGYVAAATNYDISNSSTGGTMRVVNCEFVTPAGSLSGEVVAAINPGTSGAATHVDGCSFTAAQAFNANFPASARSNYGYNPVGHVTPPGVPGTTSPLANPYGSDAFVTVVPGASTCTVSIGGTSTGIVLASSGVGGTFFVPWSQTITLAYTSAPTWNWFVS